MLYQRKKYVLAIFVTILLWGCTAMGQATNDYRTAASGNWNAIATWERYNGAAWVAATVGDGFPTSADGAIAIRGTHTVTVTANVTVDQVTVEITGRVNINAGDDWTINNGAANPDLIVDGIVDITGTLDDAGNSQVAINGTVINRGTMTINGAGSSLNFNAGSIYQHARNGGNIPIATAWNATSTCLITGVTATVPGNLDQAFGNFTWNCTGQTATLNLNEQLNSIAGNFTVSSTGTGNLELSNSNNYNLALRNYNQTGGSVIISNGTNDNNINLNISGNFALSGGTFNFSNNTNNIVNVNIAGNWSHTAGTITETSTSTGNIVFNGLAPALQTFISGGTVSNSINYTVNSGSTLQMDAEATVVNGAAFTLLSGATLGIRSAAGIAVAGVTAGNIRTTARTYNVGGNYLYNGTTAQITGSGFPTNLTGDLIINNPGFTVTLDAEGAALDARTIASGGLVNLTAGTFASGTNLTMATVSGFIRSAGSLTGTFAGGDYDVTYNGVSKTAGPELQGGFVPATRIRNFTVNLNAGASVTFAQGVGMKGVLTLTQGFLNTSLAAGFALTSTATCPGGGSTASFVNGPMARDGIAAFTYPVGAGGIYMPVAVSGTAGAIAAALPATSLIVVTPYRDNAKKIIGTALTAPLVSTSACIYWDIQRLSGGLTNIYVWLGIDEVDVCGTRPYANTDLRVTHWEAPTPSWVNKGATAVTVQNGANFIGSTIALTTFSPFTVGSITDALPVELTNFTAAKNGNAVNLKWSTASEQNNAYFNVERSADGVSFSAIGKVNGAGNSSSILNYSFTDNSPLAGKNFYRLRQVDFDGEFDLSAILSVNMAVNSSVSLYPNPVTSQALLQYPKAVKGAAYRVIAMDGRVMKSGILQENSTQMNLNLGGLQSGSYILVINNSGEQYQQRIQKQ